MNQSSNPSHSSQNASDITEQATHFLQQATTSIFKLIIIAIYIFIMNQIVNSTRVLFLIMGLNNLIV